MSDHSISPPPLLLTQRIDIPSPLANITPLVLKIAILALAFVLAPELVISACIIFLSVVLLSVGSDCCQSDD